MKKLLQLIKEHWREDFRIGYYLSFVVLLFTIVSVNYSINLENGVIDKYTGQAVRILYFFILYGCIYYCSYLLISFWNKEWFFWKSKVFWIHSVFGLLILSLDRGFPYLHEIASSFDQPFAVYAWIYKVGNHALGFAIIFLPLLLFYGLIDKSSTGFYGMTSKTNVKPYLFLLAIMVPVIGLATTQSGFTSYYPMYKSNPVAETFGWSEFIPVALFEFFYGADFINVELLFRGFFVLGMAQILGRHSVLPMVTIYCALHFGKPMGEAISSIVGGYILAVVALRTQSIWGGILVHVGVAWLMELLAYLAKVA